MEQFQKKMSIPFARSLSFPVPTSSKSRPTYQNRSVSLPARLHPVVAQIDLEIQSLRSWQQSPISSSSGITSGAWFVGGLARIDHLNSSLSDLLTHPQAQKPLRYRSRLSIWAGRLLDDSLRFADAHGSFRSAIMALKHHLSDTRAALRRRDDAALARASREQKKTVKQLLRLAADARNIGRSMSAFTADAQLAGIASEVTMVTAAASAEVFSGIAILSSAAMAGLPALGLSAKCIVGAMLCRSTAFKKRMEEEGELRRERAMERMDAMEKSMSELEIWSQRVFRRMLDIRVFLLNAQNPNPQIEETITCL